MHTGASDTLPRWKRRTSRGSFTKRLISATGFAFCLLSGLIKVGLVGAFVIDIFRWNLSPWWLWPLGVVLAVVLFNMGEDLIAIAARAP